MLENPLRFQELAQTLDDLRLTVSFPWCSMSGSPATLSQSRNVGSWNNAPVLEEARIPALPPIDRSPHVRFAIQFHQLGPSKHADTLIHGRLRARSLTRQVLRFHNSPAQLKSHRTTTLELSQSTGMIMGLFQSLFGGKGDSLLKEGMNKAKNRDTQGAIADYSAILAMPKASSELKAMALFNRALAYSSSGDYESATNDLKSILSDGTAPGNVKAAAEEKLLRYQKRADRKGKREDD